MDEVPILFREAAAALLSKPPSHEIAKFNRFPDDLWKTALCLEWGEREELSVLFYKNKTGFWLYYITRIGTHYSMETLSEFSDFKYYRFTRISFFGNSLIPPDVDEMTPLPAGPDLLLKYVQELTPQPGLWRPSFWQPKLFIIGEFDDEATRIILEWFSHIDFGQLSITAYNPVFDPILEVSLKKPRFTQRSLVGEKAGESLPDSTLDLIRDHFRSSTHLSPLFFPVRQTILTFADFELIFAALLRTPFSWKYIEDSSKSKQVLPVCQFNFEDDFKRRLSEYRTDLALEKERNMFRWRKSEDVAIKLREPRPGSWSILFCR
ncbi:hypothetical protein L596_030593 [Steinernema carpocapsae]|uniref:DUF38 domain-containing protein n=1 Tax=Steinernema carpocapsae TaxID=34508 RepID=A0A4U5LPW8_STECR|nr:hypothetical protein L596_030593 [Steinernema carpocapsae]